MTECLRVIDRIFRALENSLDCGQHGCQKLSGFCGSWLWTLSACLRAQHSKCLVFLFLFFRVMWRSFEIFSVATWHRMTETVRPWVFLLSPKKRIGDSQNNYHGPKSTPHNCWEPLYYLKRSKNLKCQGKLLNVFFLIIILNYYYDRKHDPHELMNAVTTQFYLKLPWELTVVKATKTKHDYKIRIVFLLWFQKTQEFGSILKQQ